MNEKKVKTGYRISKLIGKFSEDDEEKYLIIDGSELLGSNCNRCTLHSDYGCHNSMESEDECKRRKIFYVHPPRESRRKKMKSRYKTIDMNELSKSCIDFCMFYEENCYNIHESSCLIRLIENSSIDTY